MKRKTAQGFTLVELLVVIAIIAILAAVIVLIINPLELTRRGRDANRLSDMANLQQAINVDVQEATESGNNVLCFSGFVGGGASGYCFGDSTIGTRVTNGNGWVPVDLASQTSVQVPTLPIDPSNSKGDEATAGTAATGYHYVYCSDGTGYELATVLESAQQADKMKNDGGSEDTLYEVGSALNLVDDKAAATCKYND